MSTPVRFNFKLISNKILTADTIRDRGPGVSWMSAPVCIMDVSERQRKLKHSTTRAEFEGLKCLNEHVGSEGTSGQALTLHDTMRPRA